MNDLEKKFFEEAEEMSKKFGKPIVKDLKKEIKKPEILEDNKK